MTAVIDIQRGNHKLDRALSGGLGRRLPLLRGGGPGTT